MPVPGDWKLSIDFGSGFTMAAIADDDGIADLAFGSGKGLPSVVALDSGGRIRTGERALDLARANPPRALRQPARAVSTGAKVRLDGATVLVAELVAAVLQRVRAEAVRHQAGREPTEVVVCHSATWGDAELAEIAAAAGIPDLTFIPEPVAAARHYLTACPAPQCAEDSPIGLADGGSLTVFDFGVGLDVTPIRVDATGLTTGSLGGDPELGGDLLDERLMGLVADRAYAVDPQAWDAIAGTQDPRSTRELARLQRRVTEGRETLSRLLFADIEVPGYQAAFRVTRREFEAAAGPELERAAALAEAAITMAGLTTSGPPVLALAGAVSSTPAVSDVLASHFGVLPAVAADPKATVAHGALLGAVSRPAGRQRPHHRVFDPDNDAWLDG